MKLLQVLTWKLGAACGEMRISKHESKRIRRMRRKENVYKLITPMTEAIKKGKPKRD